MTQDELNVIYEDILNGVYKNTAYPSTILVSEDNEKIMSIIIDDGEVELIYNRKGNGPWQEMPCMRKNLI